MPDPDTWLDRARAATGNEDYDLAIHCYRQYLDARPEDLAARLALARVYAWAERYPDALSLYDALRRARPFDQELGLERARVLLWAGRYNEAIVALLAMRAELQRSTGDTTPRTGCRNRAALTWGRRSSLPRKQGVNWAAGSRTDPVCDTLRTGGDEVSLTGRVRPVADLKAKVERALADGYAWNGDAARALPLYRRLWEQHAGDPTLGLAYARLLVARKDYATALEVYHRMVARAPHDLSLRTERARVLLWAGHYDDAIVELLALRRRLGADTQRPRLERKAALEDLTRLLARAYAWSGNLEGYRSLIQEHPRDAAFRLEYARALQRVGRLKEATNQYHAYLHLIPDDLEAMREAARVFLWSGAYQDAVRLCLAVKARLLDEVASSALTAAQREEAMDEASRILAHALLWGGDPRAASSETRSLLERHPDDASLELDLAHELGQLGDFAGAREAVDRYVDKGGDTAAAALARGELYQWQGGILRARLCYRTARHDPDAAAEADEHLEVLKSSVQRAHETRVRRRADTDGFSKDTLNVASRFPVWLFWVTPAVAFDRFEGDGGQAHRVEATVEGSFWYSARWTAVALAGATYQAVDGPGDVAPELSLQSRWRAGTSRTVALEAALGDADDRLFTWSALVERVRRQEVSLTGDWVDRDKWEAWGQARATHLFSASANTDNGFFDLQGVFEHKIFPSRSRAHVRMGLTAGLLHATRQDDAYWTPSWYGTLGLKSRVQAIGPGNLDVSLSARAAMAYATDVSAFFPEFSLTGSVGQRLGTRFGWQIEGAYGQTVRAASLVQGPDSSDPARAHNYGLGHLMARAWYAY